ncbi:MAG: Holliday junction branch migration DNA helicase RuvB [Planctomycetes bacterium]|nr:Holliday junction branch migration DNA helicase RuvB [Planctomycetota bacterium]
MTEERWVDPEPLEDEQAAADRALRPERFDEFCGQRAVVENLRVYLRAAKAREEAVDHILLCGMPGLGKTTLAHLVAKELGVQIRVTSGPALERARDLVGILTELGRRDVLFIDEIHRLHPTIEEYLYSAMEDYQIDIVIDQGPNARTIRIGIQPFTLIGATTREGLLSPPFRARFGVFERLEPYPPSDLRQIIARSARRLGVEIDGEGSDLLACRSRGTPRIANRFLRRIRDLAQVAGAERIGEAIVREGLRRLGVDGNGLDPMDRKILRFIALQEGQPVGLKTIAVALGEEDRTIEEVYEPYLIQCGYLLKTPRGRVVTPEGMRVLELERA